MLIDSAINVTIASAIRLYIVISNLHPNLLGTPPKQNYLDRLEDDDRIKNKTLVFDVEQVILKFLTCIFDRRAVGILDLRPARESRSDQVSLLVKRDLFGQLGYEMRTLGPWANEAHFAFQDIPELRNLIDASLANDASDACRARVAFSGPDRAVLFGVNSHRAEFR